MRKHLLLGLGLCLALPLGTLAQKPTPPPSPVMLEQEPPAQAARWMPPLVEPMPLTGGCPANDALGSSSNAFTNILTEANPIAVDNDVNTIVFAHRNNAGVFGGHSGQLRYDVSTNGGLTWSSNLGVLNPLSVNGTNGARYPNVAIYNPAGNTDPNNAYLSYYAATVAATFNGTVSGVRRLDGTGNTETYNQPVATQTLIPRAVVKGAPGEFWAIDNVYNGTAVTGYRVLKGVWNGSTDVVWSVNTTFTPSFNTAYDGTVKTADYAIAFDPTGQIGWVCLLTHLNGGPGSYSFYPVFYKTTDGGVSWSGPTTVDLGQYPCITSNIVTGNVASAGFDVDLAVDVYGNPHALMPVCNGNNAYAVFFTQWHAMVDVTMIDGVWNPVVLRNVYRGRGTWGTAPNAVSQDMEPQVARTPDGTKVFFTWTDADSSVVLATANQSPNLFGKGYDVVQRLWTNSYNFTTCNVTWNGRILFPKMAEHVLTNTGNYKLPVVFSEFGAGTDPINPCNFHYLDSVWFAPTDFINSQCAASVNIANSDTIVTCTPISLDAGPGAQSYVWSTGALTQSISVSTSGTYWVGLSNGCCTGADTVYVMMISTPTAGFTSGVVGQNATFTNTSTGQMASYAWDFGDGNTSTSQNPTHTYAAIGTYNVCLIVTNACGADTFCNSVTATCPPATPAWSYTNAGLAAAFTDNTVGNVLGWLWDFGDGNTSTSQNPTHTYAVDGTYNVCLTITDSCGSDSICGPVTVCAFPVAAFDTIPVWWWSWDPIQFNDLSTGATSWHWDFGNGDTSNLQNPVYNYNGFIGTVTICLTVTNACGTDSSCQTIMVYWESVDPALPGVWSVSPNPAHDRAVLRGLNAPAGELRLRLLNVLGQALATRDYVHAGADFEATLDLGGLPRGIYFVELRGEQGRFTAKVVKE